MSESNRRSKSLLFQDRWASMRQSGELVPQVAAEDLVHFGDLCPELVMSRIDYDNRILPVEFAGSAIRDFLGFDLTGEDFTHYDRIVEVEEFWQNMWDFHALARGQYETLDIQFSGNLNCLCGLTSLPIIGPGGIKKLISHLDRYEASLRPVISETLLVGQIDHKEVIELSDI